MGVRKRVFIPGEKDHTIEAEHVYRKYPILDSVNIEASMIDDILLFLSAQDGVSPIYWPFQQGDARQIL